MTKHLTRAALAIVAMIVAAIISFSAAPAWADGENIVTDSSTGMGVTHTMYTNSVTNDAGITYTVVFTPITDDLESGFSATGHAAITPVVFTPATDSADTGSSEWTRNYTKQVTLPSADLFPHAGAWAYLISESASGGNSSDSSKWENSAASYIFRVYIENGDNGLVYGAWSVEEALDNGGEDIVSPEKVDATYPPATRSGLLFSSQYVKTQTLSVTKEVSGSFADRSHEFPITTTLTLPDWYHDPTSASPAPAISYVDASGTSQSGVPTYSQSNGAWELVISDGYAHGNTLTATVPVGTRYAIDETNPNASGLSYTPSVSWGVGMPVSGLKIVYNANGGRGSIGATAADPVSHEAGVTSSEYVRDGYVQIGWNTEADHSGDYYFAGDDIALSNDVTLYAVWIPENLQISYIGYVPTAAEPSNALLKTVTINANSLIDLDYDPVLDNDSTNDYPGTYVRDWYDCDFFGEVVTSPTTAKELAIRCIVNADYTSWYGENLDRPWNLNEPLKLYADQLERQISVTYVWRQVNSNRTDTRTMGWFSQPAAVQSGAYSYYNFTGWHLVDENGTVATNSDTVGSLLTTLYNSGYISDPNTSDNVSLTLYGSWEPIEYSVTYVYGYDDLSETVTLGYGPEGASELVDRPGPERTGYTFLGWTTDEAGQHFIDANTHQYTIAADDSDNHSILYAQWSAN